MIPEIDLKTPCAPGIREDLVADFLEIACRLKEKEREFLIRALASSPPGENVIGSHGAFSMDGKLIVVCEGPGGFRECWLYFPEKRRIKKMALETRE